MTRNDSVEICVNSEREKLMKILVLSDSHSTLSFMRRCIDSVQPHAVIHLGDHFDDGEAMAEENPRIPIHQVPGNCDKYRMVRYEPEVRCYPVGGVKMFMTHGHNQKVKMTLALLKKEAKEAGAQAALFGHTHSAYCCQEDGLWLLNPGSCGAYSGSAGLIETNDGKITACRILTHADVMT